MGAAGRSALDLRCSWKVSFGPSVQVKPWSLWGALEGQEASVTPEAGPEDTAEGEDAQQVWAHKVPLIKH